MTAPAPRRPGSPWPRTTLALSPLLLASLLAHCGHRDDRIVPTASSAAATGAAASDPASDEVRPVYPLEVAPHPLAERLCRALHARVAERRAACCGGAPPTAVTGECVRMLSASLRAGAVAVTDAAVDACAAATEADLAGCEWVGPLPPAPPSACRALLSGQLADGARCRSSLECGPARRCLGVGPTQPGRCGAPRGSGAACGLAVDALAVFTRQDDADAAHPECEGLCDHHRCVPRAPAGEACGADVQCQPGLHCDGRRCQPGATAHLGDPCTSACDGGARCLRGRCALPAATGAPCDSDLQCRGACLPRDGGARTCGPACDRR